MARNFGNGAINLKQTNPKRAFGRVSTVTCSRDGAARGDQIEGRGSKGAEMMTGKFSWMTLEERKNLCDQ